MAVDNETVLRITEAADMTMELAEQWRQKALAADERVAAPEARNRIITVDKQSFLVSEIKSVSLLPAIRSIDLNIVWRVTVNYSTDGWVMAKFASTGLNDQTTQEEGEGMAREEYKRIMSLWKGVDTDQSEEVES